MKPWGNRLHTAVANEEAQMKGRHNRVFRILASALTAAAVVVPVTGAAGSSDGSAQPKSGGQLNVILRNDNAHWCGGRCHYRK
jgi:hypothetical protein